MARSRDELSALLDDLERELSDLVRDHPGDAEFWHAFAGRADVIEDSAGVGADAHDVIDRIDHMLARYGKQIARVDLDYEDDNDDPQL